MDFAVIAADAAAAAVVVVVVSEQRPELAHARSVLQELAIRIKRPFHSLCPLRHSCHQIDCQDRHCAHCYDHQWRFQHHCLEPAVQQKDWAWQMKVLRPFPTVSPSLLLVPAIELATAP